MFSLHLSGAKDLLLCGADTLVRVDCWSLELGSRGDDLMQFLETLQPTLYPFAFLISSISGGTMSIKFPTTA